MPDWVTNNCLSKWSSVLQEDVATITRICQWRLYNYLSLGKNVGDKLETIFVREIKLAISISTMN